MLQLWQFYWGCKSIRYASSIMYIIYCSNNYNVLSMYNICIYILSLLCNMRLGVGTLIMTTSSAINKKITLQSTSATNVASVAFAIQHKNKIIITFFLFLLFTTDSYIVIVGIVNCIVDTLVIPIDSYKVFQHCYSILHTITYSIRNNQHNINIFVFISDNCKLFLVFCSFHCLLFVL